jgi:hypothetical protein
LADHGTCWVNLGDSYNSGASGGLDGSTLGGGQDNQRASNRHGRGMVASLKPKDLVGIPWRVAFALQDDGWWLRSDIIWAKPNPMPESVTDRPTKAHEYVFLLAKQPRYFFDQEAVREPHTTTVHRLTKPTDEYAHGLTPEQVAGRKVQRGGKALAYAYTDGVQGNPAGRNVRSVWEIPTQPYPGAHFATWPQKLVARMILAGTSERGCCPECGAPWVRDVERTPMEVVASPKRKAWQGSGDDFARTQIGGTVKKHPTALTLGWSPSCDHPHQPIPCTVLDPFAGSGTTMLVARNHGRHSIGIELNEDYCRIAADRLSQLSLLTGDAA